MADSSLKRGIGMTQAELGHAAVKIGGSVLSGMKSLGGLAFSAAKAGVNAAVSGEFGAGAGVWCLVFVSAVGEKLELINKYIYIYSSRKRNSNSFPFISSSPA